MKTQKTIIVIGGVTIAAILAYKAADLITVNQKKQAAKSADEEKIRNEGLDPNELFSNELPNTNDNFPMTVGMFGARVAVLQQALNNLGENLTVDGRFGNLTYDAVRAKGGYSAFNLACRFTYNCGLSYESWLKITAQAVSNGFDINKAWTKAKQLYKLPD